MRKALIIADYGKNTGIGHLTRCGSLAKKLSDCFSVKFICLEAEYLPFVAEFAEKNNCSAVALPDNPTFFGEADVIVVDSYKITTKFLTDIKNICKICAVIDDNCLLPFYDADYIINQNIGAETLSYEPRIRKDTELLLGLDYLMLRDAFLEKRPADVPSEIDNIVITMGGADLKKATEKVLGFIEKHKNYVYNVVVGPDFGKRPELVKYARRNENVVLYYNADMPELFSRCRGAVSACGSTVYELAAMGVPTVGVVTADNQQNASIAMENGGIIASAGIFEMMSEQYFDTLFLDVMENDTFRKKMHERQIGLARKDGAEVIKNKIIERLEG